MYVLIKTAVLSQQGRSRVGVKSLLAKLPLTKSFQIQMKYNTQIYQVKLLQNVNEHRQSRFRLIDDANLRVFSEAGKEKTASNRCHPKHPKTSWKFTRSTRRKGHKKSTK